VPKGGEQGPKIRSGAHNPGGGLGDPSGALPKDRFQVWVPAGTAFGGKADIRKCRGNVG